jgi:hypothetical protein
MWIASAIDTPHRDEQRLQQCNFRSILIVTGEQRFLILRRDAEFGASWLPEKPPALSLEVDIRAESRVHDRDCNIDIQNLVTLVLEEWGNQDKEWRSQACEVIDNSS